MVSIPPERLDLCTAFLNDCYEIHGGGPDLWSTGNIVANYARAEIQATYSVMYFAKSVACWWTMRDLVQPSGVAGSDVVVSIGAGPAFCLMGWFFERSPTTETKADAVDYLAWSGVTNLDSHERLREDILGDTLRTRIGYYFPEEKPPQCAADSSARPLSPKLIPADATVLLPMVMNHLLGKTGHVADIEPLREWFSGVEQRTEKIVLIDMRVQDDTRGLWDEISDLLGLESPPPIIRFDDYGRRFAPCYGDRLLPHGQQFPLPERERRTGKRHKFTEVSACFFERDSGWRWLAR